MGAEGAGFEVGSSGVWRPEAESDLLALHTPGGAPAFATRTHFQAWLLQLWAPGYSTVGAETRPRGACPRRAEKTMKRENKIQCHGASAC